MEKKCEKKCTKRHIGILRLKALTQREFGITLL